MNADVDLSDYTWNFVENINNGLCQNSHATAGHNSGYAEAKTLWDNRKIPCSIMEMLDLALHCHRLAPFFFFNGASFTTVVRSALNSQLDISSVRLLALRSLAEHFVVGTISLEEKQALSLLLNTISATLTVGDAVQTLKGTVRGVVVELLPDGCVKYRTAQGIIIKASADALLRR